MLVGLIVQNESRVNAEIQSGIDKTIREYRGARADYKNKFTKCARASSIS